MVNNTHRHCACFNKPTVHLELGAEDDAMQCYQQALQVEIKALGPNHLDLTLTLQHILQVHQQRGEIAQAIDCCLEILRLQTVNHHLLLLLVHHHHSINSNSNVMTVVQTVNCLANLRLQTGDGAIFSIKLDFSIFHAV